MSLTTGTRLGPYEIVSAIGAGGMGEVYRARDTKLDRDVAIKVLPPQLAENAMALARFEREAKAVAALSHPNILSIFDFGSERGVAYAVTELLDGHTLREALGSALSARKTIDYGTQIARGLAAAHAKGIVHRDLKPENAFVTRDGRVKILDFGLARQAVAFAGADVTASPTFERHTEPGTVLGTVGYMSPEQVRGETGDHRSDIFSFGCVLYEMLMGRRAFQRGTAAETMTAILREDPPEPDPTLSAAVPPGLVRIVHHCLEKEADQRFQSASDVAFALEALSTASASTSSAAAIPAAPRSNRRLLFIAGAAAAVLIGTAAFAAGRLSRPPVRDVTFTPLTYRQQTIYRALFAPDGKTMVFSAALSGSEVELFTMSADFPEARSLGVKNTQLLSVSSKSELAVLTNTRFVGHRLFEGTLARMPLSGGAPREILERVREADWSPDGASLAVVRDVGGRDRLEYPVGKVVYESSGYISDPRVSPSGDQVAFFEHPMKYDDRGGIVVVDRSGKKTPLSPADAYPGLEGLAWSRDGSEVLFSAGVNYSQFKVFAATLSGQIRQALESAGGLTLFDVGPDGRWLAARDDITFTMMGKAQGAAGEINLSWLDFSLPAAIADDGATLIFTEDGVGSSYALCLRKMDGSPLVRLGEGSGNDLSRDGKWVLSIVPGQPEHLMIYPTGAGEARRIDRGPIEHYQSARWFPDGTRFIVCGAESGRATRCYLQDAKGGAPRPLTPEDTGSAIVAPDAQSVVVRRGAERAAEIYPVGGGETRAISSIGKDDDILRWNRDGTLVIAHITPGQVPVRLERLRIDTGQRELIRTLTPANPVGVNAVMALAVGENPDAYAYSISQQLSRLFLVMGAR
jgi:eukaryotic-like serine/threonine-protein kinase